MHERIALFTIAKEQLAAAAGIFGERTCLSRDMRDAFSCVRRDQITEDTMAVTTIARNAGRGVAMAGALAAVLALTAAPQAAEARGGWGPAVGVGIGAFALGTAVGAAANPYYYGGYPYAYSPPPYSYYPAAPGYYYPY